MIWTPIMLLLALVEYIGIAVATGRARGRAGLQAPAMTGDEQFERHYRVQMNTLEQLIVFVPASLMFAWYVSDSIGAVLAFLFLVGRAMYFRGYVADPTSRGKGFIISFAANMILLLGALVGAVLTLA